MISEDTANRISNACNDMNDCKNAIALFKGKQKLKYPVVSVSTNCNDNDITIVLLNNIAKEAIEKQLAALQGEYQALNKIALDELRDLKPLTGARKRGAILPARTTG